MLNITKQGNSIKVVGVNNPTYPYSGTLTYPLNSIILVVDSSNMATFRSAANNDVLFTGIITDITINGTPQTKETIGQQFGAISNASTGGGGTGGGAVDSVNGQTGTVVLTANDVNAYAKNEVDGLLSAKVGVDVYNRDIPTLATKEELALKADKSSLGDYLLKTEAQSNYETISGAQGKYQAKLKAGTGIEITGENVINVTLDTNIYQVVESLPDTEINPNKIYLVLSAESGETNLYTEYLYVNSKWEKIGEYKADVDLTPYLKSSEAASTYATKQELAGEVSEREKQDSALGGMIAGETEAREQAINNLTATVNGKLDTATYNSEKATFETKENAAATYQPKGSYLTSIPDEYVTDTELSAKNYATQDWVTEQGYLTEHQDISGLATKEELNGKQDVLVSGTNIKTINGNTILGSGNITLEGGVKEWDFSVLKANTEERQRFISEAKPSDVIKNVPHTVTDDTLVDCSIASISGDDDMKYCCLVNTVIAEPYLTILNVSEATASVSFAFKLSADYSLNETSYNPIANKAVYDAIAALKTELPTKTSELQNDSGFMTNTEADTAYQAKGDYALKSEVPKQYVQDISFIAPSSINIFDQDGNMKMIGFADGITLGEKGENVEVKLDDSFVDKVNGKQDTLVSGTNIKTINGNSLLGSGDITIEGGTGSGVKEWDFAQLQSDAEYRTDFITNAKASDIVNNVLYQSTTYDHCSILCIKGSTYSLLLNNAFDPMIAPLTVVENSALIIAAINIYTIVDSVLSDDSTNPVQNKVIKAELDKMANARKHDLSTYGGMINAGDTLTNVGSYGLSKVFVCVYSDILNIIAIGLNADGNDIVINLKNEKVEGTWKWNVKSEIEIGGGTSGSGIATWDYAQLQSDQEYRTNFLSNVKVSDDLINLGGSDNPEHASILTIDGNVYTVMYNVGGNPKVASINVQESVATITNIDAIPKNVATTTENGLMSSADKTKLDSIDVASILSRIAALETQMGEVSAKLDAINGETV